MNNIYGARIEKHFHCGHNISTDPQLLLAIRAVDGLNVHDLSDEEKEFAAKAIEHGYIQREGDRLYPKMLVYRKENEEDFYDIVRGFKSDMAEIAENISKNLAELIKKTVPAYLMDDYHKIRCKQGRFVMSTPFSYKSSFPKPCTHALYNHSFPKHPVHQSI